MFDYTRSFDDAIAAVRCKQLRLPCGSAEIQLIATLQRLYGWEGVFELYQNQASVDEGDACTPPAEVRPQDQPKPQEDPRKEQPSPTVVCEVRPL